MFTVKIKILPLNSHAIVSKNSMLFKNIIEIPIL